MKLSDCILVIVLFLGTYYFVKHSSWKLSSMNTLMISFAIPLIYLLITKNKKYEGFDAEADNNQQSANSTYDTEYNDDSNTTIEEIDKELNYPGKPDYVDPDIADAREIANIDKAALREINMREAEERKKIRKQYRYEMPYTIAHEYNTRPLGRAVPGYTYLPPENWFRPWDREPICAGNKGPAMPTTSSAPLDQQYLEFDTHVDIERPIEIDTHYLDEIQNHRAGNKRRVKE